MPSSKPKTKLRTKPKAKPRASKLRLRPWTRDEVPHKCWIWFKHWAPGDHVRLIATFNDSVVMESYAGCLGLKYYKELCKNGLYSVDAGKTWHLCGVLEGKRQAGKQSRFAVDSKPKHL